MKILIYGPQGVGKGTQAGLLAAHHDSPHVSTGDLFRANIEANSALGQQARQLIAAGELVPDSITQAMLAERLDRDDAQHGFILDGFPRTTAQAQWLEVLNCGTFRPDRVVLLTAPYEVLVSRALQRGRADDTQEVIDRRLALYNEHTQPLLNYYASITHSVDGNRPVHVVHQDIIRMLSDSQASSRTMHAAR